MSCFSCGIGLKLICPSGNVLCSLKRRSTELGVKLLPMTASELICKNCSDIWEAFGELEMRWKFIVKRFKYEIVNRDITEPLPVSVSQPVIQSAPLSKDPLTKVNECVPVAPVSAFESTPDKTTTINDPMSEENSDTVIGIANCNEDNEKDVVAMDTMAICEMGDCVKKKEKKSYFGAEIIIHKMKHHNFKLNCCGIEFPCKDHDFKKHFRSHIKGMNASANQNFVKKERGRPSTNNNLSNKAKCPMQGCSSYLQITSLFSHLKKIHCLKTTDVQKLQLQIPCELCNKTFIVSEYVCRQNHCSPKV